MNGEWETQLSPYFYINRANAIRTCWAKQLYDGTYHSFDTEEQGRAYAKAAAEALMRRGIEPNDDIQCIVKEKVTVPGGLFGLFKHEETHKKIVTLGKGWKLNHYILEKEFQEYQGMQIPFGYFMENHGYHFLTPDGKVYEMVSRELYPQDAYEMILHEKFELGGCYSMTVEEYEAAYLTPHEIDIKLRCEHIDLSSGKFYNQYHNK